MRVLVTGACGFIGLNLVEALLAQGESVIGLDRNPPPRGFPHFPCRELDVREPDSLHRVFEAERPEAVVHAAALTPGRAAERNRMASAVEINVLATVHVMEAAVRTGCARVLYLSSAAVYGANEDPVLSEDSAPAPRSLYGITKLAAEQLALRYRDTAGLEVVAARLAAAFGPWEADTGSRDTLSPFYRIAHLSRAGEEAILPRRSTLDWIYSREAAAALAFVLKAPGLRSSLVNVGPGPGYDLERFCAAAAKRHAKFRWRIDPAQANIDLFGPHDRAPLSTARLRAAGFAARFDEAAAYADYFDWLETTCLSSIS